MSHRRRFKQPPSSEYRLAEEAKRLREAADKAEAFAERERLLRQAQQTEIAAHLNDWLTSPGLQPPI